MTRQEKEKLHSEKCHIEMIGAKLPQGAENRYIVSMSLTNGELLALKNALSSYRSAVGGDLDAYLTNAGQRAGIQL